MNIEQARNYCLTLEGATESFPFDEESLVFKVGEKMFALLPLDAEAPIISLKCDPDIATELREKYRAVEPAYHFNKKHWNSILLESDMNDDDIEKFITHSYQLVVSKLPKAKRPQAFVNYRPF